MLDTGQQVGVSEFQENLSAYLDSKTAVSITRDGLIIGVYVPTRSRPSEADVAAFEAAGETVRQLMTEAGVTEDELVEEFKLRRRQE